MGATTLSIKTFSLISPSIQTQQKDIKNMTLGIMRLSIMVLVVMLNVTFF